MPRKPGGLIAVRDYSAVRDILIPYRRVSTREQADHGAGLPAQRTVMEAGLLLRGATAYDWSFVDRGKSGKDMNRDELSRALATVRAGKAGGIMVSKLDRLSRSLLDFAILMAAAAKEGWNIVALDLGVDLSTPAGKAMAGVLAVFAQFERDVISQRTKDGLAEKRAAGVQIGRRRTISDELLEAVISAFHALGGNYSATARWLNDAGVTPVQNGQFWYPDTVRKLLISPHGREASERLVLTV